MSEATTETVISASDFDGVRAQTVKYATTQLTGITRIKEESILTPANKPFHGAFLFSPNNKTVILDVVKAMEIMGRDPVVIEGPVFTQVNGYAPNPANPRVQYTRATRPLTGKAVELDGKQQIFLVMGWTSHNDLQLRPTYTLVVDSEPGQPQYRSGVTVWKYYAEPNPEKVIMVEPEKNFAFYLSEAPGSNLKQALYQIMGVAKATGLPIEGSTNVQFPTEAAHREYRDAQARRAQENRRRNLATRDSRGPAMASSASYVAGTSEIIQSNTDPFAAAGLNAS